MDDKIRDATVALAMWWSDKILNRQINKDNGDDNPMTFMLASMASMNARKSMEVSQQQAAEVFESRLEKILVDNYAKRGEAGMSLDCDYAPCEDIADAMREAKIPLLLAPWKTHTYVKDGHAYGSYGYGKPYEKII